MSFASASGGSDAKKGANWTYKIYFLPEAADVDSDPHEIEDEELIKKLKELLNVDERIERVWAFKQKLSPYQVTMFLLYHMFILLKTRDWWWSIEKNSEGITIQRSRNKQYVKDKYRQQARPSVTEMKEDTGNGSIMDLIEWLYKENELNKEYNVYNSNCQNFAAAVFNYVATSKRF